jgi:hypothetical protein
MRGNRLFLGCEKTKVKFIDPRLGPGEIERDLSEFERGDGEDSALRQLERNNLDQIVCFCFDTSSSMKLNVNGLPTKNDRSLSRQFHSKEYLKAFVARVNAYRITTAFGLISFNDVCRVEARCQLIETSFANTIEHLAFCSNTKLWDGILLAVKQVIDFDGPANAPEFPNAKRRIIVISDGCDFKSDTEPFTVLQTLLAQNIVLGVVMVCSGTKADKNPPLCLLAKLSGGIAFQATDLHEGLRFFECEPFLNLRLRVSDDSDLDELLSTVTDNESFGNCVRRLTDGQLVNWERMGNRKVIRAKDPFDLCSAEVQVRTLSEE